MSNYVHHPYHLVEESPWPLLSSLGAFFLTTGLVKWFHVFSLDLVVFGLILILLIMLQWWRDVAWEGALQGLHTKIVETGLRWGMILFIVSEVFFFLSFFWAFFHSSLSPSIEGGASWPIKGVSPFLAFKVPLLNTIILLASGVSVTWSHHSLMAGEYFSSMLALLMTVALGFYFSGVQAMEYWEASFSISEGIYGSSFYVATGFHGLHVLVGTTFLVVCLLRILKGHMSASHHFGFEAAAWYWHFVDVVWLFLFVSIYWWGGL